MRTPKKRKRAGFTLIELVAALALSGMALVFTAMLLTISTSLYISSSHTMEDSQKFQVALNRLVKELTFAAAGTVEASVPGRFSGRLATRIDWPSRWWQLGMGRVALNCTCRVFLWSTT